MSASGPVPVIKSSALPGILFNLSQPDVASPTDAAGPPIFCGVVDTTEPPVVVGMKELPAFAVLIGNCVVGGITFE